MRVYFDYNATTPVTPDVAEAVGAAMRDQFGNASSIHHFGQQAKAAIDEARSAVARLAGADPSEIVFTAGGTESDNFAIRGAADALEPTGRRHLMIMAAGTGGHVMPGLAVAREVVGQPNGRLSPLAKQAGDGARTIDARCSLVHGLRYTRHAKKDEARREVLVKKRGVSGEGTERLQIEN